MFQGVLCFNSRGKSQSKVVSVLLLHMGAFLFVDARLLLLLSGSIARMNEVQGIAPTQAQPCCGVSPRFPPHCLTEVRHWSSPLHCPIIDFARWSVFKRQTAPTGGGGGGVGSGGARQNHPPSPAPRRRRDKAFRGRGEMVRWERRAAANTTSILKHPVISRTGIEEH